MSQKLQLEANSVDLIIEVDTKEPKHIYEEVYHQIVSVPKFAEDDEITFKTTKKHLEFGDLKCMDLGAERKEVTSDAVNSIRDGRLAKQIHNMVQNYNHVYILFSGNLLGVARDEDIRAVLSICADLQLRYGVSIMFLPNDEYLVHYFLVLCMKHHKELKPLSTILRPQLTKEDQSLLSLMGTDGIGKKTAELLLIDNKTLKQIYNATLDQLMKTKGVGIKLATKIYEVANKTYKKKEKKHGKSEKQKKFIKERYKRKFNSKNTNRYGKSIR